MLPYWKGVFANVETLRILRWDENSGVSRWVLNAITCVIREGQREMTETHRGQANVRLEQRAMWPQPRNDNSCRKWEEVRSGCSPGACRGSADLPTHWFQTSSLQNCWFKPLSLRAFVTAALGRPCELVITHSEEYQKRQNSPGSAGFLVVILRSLARRSLMES